MSLFFPHSLFETIYDIPADYFAAHGIRGVLLDIDNTLAHYGAKEPNAQAIAYVKRLAAQGLCVSVLSNNSEERVGTFCKKLGVSYLSKARKPLGGGIRRALAAWGMRPEEACLVGDQIFTDVLGGRLAGVHTVLVMPFDHRENSFIRLKRVLEKPFLRAYHRKQLRTHGEKH